jgi:hypothetical protein
MLAAGGGDQQGKKKLYKALSKIKGFLRQGGGGEVHFN